MLPPCFPIFPLAERNPEFATPATPCSVLFPLSATAPCKRYLQSRSSFIARPDAGWLCLCMCMGVCVSHFQVFPSAVRKAARWYLGDCRLRGRAPGSTRAPPVSEERVMGVGGGLSRRVGRHHVTPGLRASRRAPTRSGHVMDVMKSSKFSLMRPAHKDTMGAWTSARSLWRWFETSQQKGGLDIPESFSHMAINKDLFKEAVVHKIYFFEL